MTRSEYQELVEFIAPRLDGIDERLRRVEILGEENRHQTQIVAEAVSGIDGKLQVFRSEVAAGFRELLDFPPGAGPTCDASGGRR